MRSRSKGYAVAFVGTGQTGIFIDGKGISVDAVVADFIGGAAEQLVLEAAKTADIVLVEGQGSSVASRFLGRDTGPAAWLAAARTGAVHAAVAHDDPQQRMGEDSVAEGTDRAA